MHVKQTVSLDRAAEEQWHKSQEEADREAGYACQHGCVMYCTVQKRRLQLAR